MGISIENLGEFRAVLACTKVAAGAEIEFSEERIDHSLLVEIIFWQDQISSKEIEARSPPLLFFSIVCFPLMINAALGA